MSFYTEIDRFCLENGISERIDEADALLIAYSGGADSSLLLDYVIARYKDKKKIAAFHLNHGIRGDEALRDECFCRNRCEKYGILFFCERRNIPLEAEGLGMGIEEAARSVRYELIREICEKLGERTCVLTAHNATDNLETVIFNLARGTGIRGLGGISPVRDNILRPLLCLTSDEVRGACGEMGIDFVFDSTNAEDDYTRNYIRHEIVPRLYKLNSDADGAARRLARIAREADEYISGEALKLILGEGRKYILRNSFSECSAALKAAVLRELYRSAAGSAAELSDINVRLAAEFAENGLGKLSMPRGVTFFCESERIYFDSWREVPLCDDRIKIRGDGAVAEFGKGFAVCACPAGSMAVYDENIYNLFIKHTIAFDTIYGSLFVRRRKTGDKIFTCGMHKKLKKLMCDKKMPTELRDHIPVFEDDKGLLLVPSLCIRDGASGSGLDIYVLIKKGISYE